MSGQNPLADLNPEELKLYFQQLKRLRKSPTLFAKRVLGIESLEEYQKRMCRAIVEYDRVAIKACHAVGKTFTLGGVIVPWFTSCFENSIVITTAPTNRQVETLLWGEIRKSYKRSKTALGGKMLTKKWTISEDWYAIGFSPQASAGDGQSQEQQGSSFQGFHAKHVLIIFDEATGIPHDIYTMAEGLLTSGVIVKWVCIANPTSTTSEFFNICRKAEWHVMTINCFDSPNMIANGFVNRQTLEIEINYLKTLSDYERMKRIKEYKKPNGVLLSAQWAIAKIFEWGFDHPLTKSKILGEFPDKSDDVVVKWDSVQAAVNRERSFTYEKRFIGVDVARYGDDSTVITEIQDTSYAVRYVHMKEDTAETTGRVVAAFWAGDSQKETHIAIDCTGVGGGVYDNLRELKRNNELPEYVYIHEVHFGVNIVHEDDEQNEILNQRYENQKVYIFELLNKDLRDKISLPNEEIYQTETVSLMYKFSKRGKLMMESKDDFKKRVKKSPDSSDSLALANFARYLKPNYGIFKGKEQIKIAAEANSLTNKFDKFKNKSRIKVIEH